MSTAARATRNRSALTFVYDGDNETLAHVTGALDENLRQIENELEITIQRRGHRFRVEGAPSPPSARCRCSNTCWRMRKSP